MSIQIPKTIITDENIEWMGKSLLMTRDSPKRKTNSKFYFESLNIPFL